MTIIATPLGRTDDNSQNRVKEALLTEIIHRNYGNMLKFKAIIIRYPI